MNFDSFIKELSGMPLFPQSVLDYARQTAQQLTDDGREALAGQLHSIYQKFQPIESQRRQEMSNAQSSLTAMQKQETAAVRKQEETAADAGALEKIEGQLPI